MGKLHFFIARAGEDREWAKWIAATYFYGRENDRGRLILRRLFSPLSTAGIELVVENLMFLESMVALGSMSVNMA